MKRILAFAPAAAWALFILWLGSVPSLPAPGWPLFDKVGHFAVFGVLGVLLALATRHASARASLVWPLLAGILVGVADELRQRSVDGRSSDPLDLLADAAGCAIALWLTRVVLDRRAERRVRNERRSANPIQEHRA